MATRESFAQARDNLERAREEAKARFNEWAALLAKEAAEDALRLVAGEEGVRVPASGEIVPLVEAVLGGGGSEVREAAARIDEIYDPVQVDVETAGPAELEGGKAAFVRPDEAEEIIALAETVVDACEERSS